MPLDQATKVASLQAAGLDPSQFDIDDGGNVTQKVNQLQPTINPKPVEAPIMGNGPSITGSTLRAAGASAIPTTAGLAGGMGTGALLASLGLAPESGGASLIPLALSLMGGLGASYGAGKVQNALTPKPWQETLQKDIETNPIASRLGGFIPAALAFNPVKGLVGELDAAGNRVGGIVGNVKSAGKVLGQGMDSISAGERTALTDAAINTGVAGGQNIYEQQDSGKPFDYGSLGIDLAGGALLNTPSALGKAVGFHSGVDINNRNLKIRAAALVEAEQNAKAAQVEQPKPIEYPPTPNPISGNEPLSTSGLMTPRELGPDIVSTPKSDATRKWVEDVSPKPEQLNTMEGEGGISPKPNLSDWDKAELEKAAQDVAEQRKAKAELDRQEAAQLATENSNRALEIKNREAELQKSLTQNQIVAKPPTETPFIKNAAGEETSIPAKDYTGVTEQANKEVVGESAADLAARKTEGLGDKYQEKSPLDTANWDELPPEYKAKVASIAAKRGITLQEARSVTDSVGNEKLGVYQPTSRIATVSGPKGRADTAPHEILGHGHTLDLLNSGISGDNILANRVLNIFGGNKAAAEETLAMRRGLDGYKRSKIELGDSKSAKFELWYKDFLSRMKYKFGVASDEDALRVIDQRGFHDAPYGMRGEIVPKADRLTQLRAITNPTEEQTREKASLEKESQTNNSKDAWKGMGFQDRSAIESLDNASGKPVVDLPPFADMLRNKEVTRIVEDLHKRSIIPERASYDKEYFKSLDESDKDKVMRIRSLAKQKTLEKVVGAPEGQMYEEPGNPKYASGSAINGADKTTTGPESVDLEARKAEILGAKKVVSPLDYKTFSPTRSLLDSIRMKHGPEGNALADSAAKLLEEKDSLKARYMHPIDTAYSDTTPVDREWVDKTLIAEDREGKSYKDKLQNPQQEHLYDAIRDSLKQKQLDQIKDEQPVYDYKTGEMRNAKINPFYYPGPIDLRAIKLLQDPSHNQATFDNVKSDFLAHQKEQGNSPEISQKMWDDLVQGQTPANKLGLKGGGGAENYFKANRVSEGVGLPDSMLYKGDIMKKMSRYFSKVAADRAFYRNIESNPDVAKSIGMKNDAWGNELKSEAKSIGGEDVNTLLQEFRGERSTEDETNTKAFNRVATAAMLGPGTNAHIFASSLAGTIPYFRAGEAVEGIKYSITNYQKQYENALKTGYARKDYHKISDMFNSQNTFAERLNGLASGINTLGGRGLVNHVTKGLLQGAGKFIVESELSRAASGDNRALNLMKQIDPKFDPSKNYTEEEKNQFASNLAGMIHGNHDARTLPRILLHDSAIQPFLALASWNVAQTNNFMRHVWTPATNGNFEPLLMSTLGAGLGGYMLKKMRETLSDKKSPIPAFEELKNSSRGLEGNIPLVAYNLMAMSSMAGYGGILSMLGKTGFDAAYKNMPQGASFPLDEIVISSAKTITDAAAALGSASSLEEYAKIGSKASIDLVKENVQLARLAHSWLVQVPGLAPEQLRSKNINAANRDLRSWKMAEGMPYQPQESSESNPYLDLPYKSFKKTEDVLEAAKELPSLISIALDRSQGNGEVLRAQLSKIKSNSFQTMPNPDEIPMTFMRYVEYLRKTKGEEAANERIQEYFKENFLNKMKASMVPSF